jgi:hypothetical protein
MSRRISIQLVGASAVCKWLILGSHEACSVSQVQLFNVLDETKAVRANTSQDIQVTIVGDLLDCFELVSSLKLDKA